MKIWVNGELKIFEENLTVYNLVKEIGVLNKNLQLSAMVRLSQKVIFKTH